MLGSRGPDPLSVYEVPVPQVTRLQELFGTCVLRGELLTEPISGTLQDVVSRDKLLISGLTGIEYTGVFGKKVPVEEKDFVSDS